MSRARSAFVSLKFFWSAAQPGRVVGRLLDAASGSGTTSGEMWRYTSPYRGLAAMEEKDSDYFFGRARETVDVLTALAAASDRLPVLLGNSGVGKSSLALAGALAALKRQAWPERVDAAPEWPHAFHESRQLAGFKVADHIPKTHIDMNSGKARNPVIDKCDSSTIATILKAGLFPCSPARRYLVT